MPTDFYDLFDVSSDASQDDIESAYLQLVKEYHPDRNSSDNAEDQFKTVQKAYDVLTNRKERQKYDKLGHARYVRSYMRNVNGFEFTAEEPDPNPLETPPNSNPQPYPKKDTPDETSPESETGSTDDTDDTDTVPEPDTTTERDSTPDDNGGDDTTSTSSTPTPSTDAGSTTSTTSSTSSTTSTRSPVDDIPFKPKVHRSIGIAVTSIVSILLLYLYGTFSFALAEQGSLPEFVREFISTPSSVFGLNMDIQQPTVLIDAVMATPLANIGTLLFLLGIVALPAATAAVVWTLGGNRPSLWLYVLGTLPPVIAMVGSFATGIQFSPAVAAIIYLAVPTITAGVFITDIMSFIIRKYIEFYIAHYRMKYHQYFG